MPPEEAKVLYAFQLNQLVESCCSDKAINTFSKFSTMQLGVQWCDFVLWSAEGPPSSQRIYRQEELIYRIMNANYTLWQYIIAPEIFEMRVPQG